MDNAPENFETLFAFHRGVTWEENVTRLVQATDEIVPSETRLVLTDSDCSNILSAATLAATLSIDRDYLAIGETLAKAVSDRSSQILQAAAIDNVNLRGNAIEQLITTAGNFHTLEDLVFALSGDVRVFVDVKTKIVNLKSSPKAYNIDKYLRVLSQGRTAISFFFLGIDRVAGTIMTGLASTLDKSILEATRVQFHWAGRNSRGVTQLTGDLSGILNPDFRESVEINRAHVFLQELIDL